MLALLFELVVLAFLLLSSLYLQSSLTKSIRTMRKGEMQLPCRDVNFGREIACVDSRGHIHTITPGGVILLELLIYLTLGACLLIAFTTTTVRVFQHTKNINEKINNYHKREIARSIFTRAMLASDTHRLMVSPRVLSSNELLALGFSTNTQPQHGSRGFANLAVDLKSTFKVLEANYNVGSYYMVGCPAQPEGYLWRDYVAFLAVNPESVTKVFGSSQKTSTTSKCRKFHLINASSNIMPVSKDSSALFATVLIPIREEFLIYLDTFGRLRRVSYENGIIKENQPLLYDLSQLFISEVEGSAVFKNSFTLRFKKGRYFTFDINNLLGRYESNVWVLHL